MEHASPRVQRQWLPDTSAIDLYISLMAYPRCGICGKKLTLTKSYLGCVVPYLDKNHSLRKNSTASMFNGSMYGESTLPSLPVLNTKQLFHPTL